MKIKFISGIVLLAAILSISLYSCEKDDICVDAVTPRLIIRFYDQTDLDIPKRVTNLKVTDLDGNAIYINEIDTVETLDSIAIPLKTLEDTSSFLFYTNYGINDEGEEVGNPDMVTFSYTRNELYVSRACGYKVNYSNLYYVLEDDDDNWISTINTQTTDVLDETAPHVYIYH